ncbi:glycosyltransferase [Paenibacillus albicereus]|uniref:Glycosyltransferase n=1 Tax=Paenibacillus albicereus TaxID=2726185 RepID=A0A6H2H2E7_9BACL|nr:glycosyltransferase [Paenibacillus albicereus]QJC53873.1 glycosyltransferase [Paenibacillus albicereus]
MEHKSAMVKHQLEGFDQDSILRIHELNKAQLMDLNSQLMRAEHTKAWKIMCAVRRFNEQYRKGNSSERKQFWRWLRAALSNKDGVREDAKRFSPIKSDFKIHDFQLTQGKAPLSSPVDQAYQHYVSATKFDVFRFPVIEWDFRWQRPQQISSQFADHGHRVFYFSIETTGLGKQDAVAIDFENRVQIRELQKNVWWIKLCSLQDLNAYRDQIEGKDREYLEQSLRFISSKFNIQDSISILDLPFWYPLASVIPNNVLVYDCMDDHAGFSTNSQLMLTQEDDLIAKADLVIATSQLLYDKVIEYNPNTLLIRNAGEYDHFSRVPEGPTPDDIKAIKGRIIGYYGAISEWFDIELIERLATNHPEWSFVLIGDTFGCDISKVEKLKNVYLLGEKPYSSLPNYLDRFDVCLIPFLVNNLTLSTNPVKVYEYLASGKPVVSVALPELVAMKEVVYLANAYSEFEHYIQEALDESDVALQEKRKKFAKQNSWSSRYESLSDKLNRNYYPKVSIVIVTYNNWNYTKQCLDSVFKNSKYSNLEIIIVDNMSSDSTRIELSRMIHPQVKVILSPQNLGFAGGNAAGCQAASGEYIILLNNDTMVPEGWLQRLLRPLKENAQLGMSGPMSNSVGNDQMLDFFIGNEFDGPDTNWLHDFYAQYNGRARSTELLGFYCVAISRKAYEAVGDLDTGYGIGMFEDDDYCERVQRAGYGLVIVEDCFVYHHGSVSFKKLDDKIYQNTFQKNKQYFELKWKKSWSMPKPPASIFYQALDSVTVNERVKAVAQNTYYIEAGLNWISGRQGIESSLTEFAKGEDALVIVNAHQYNGSPVTGIRKLGPSLYLSNRPDLFDGVEFEAAFYAERADKNKHIQSKQVVYLTQSELTATVDLRGLLQAADRVATS